MPRRDVTDSHVSSFNLSLYLRLGFELTEGVAVKLPTPPFNGCTTRPIVPYSRNKNLEAVFLLS